MIAGPNQLYALTTILLDSSWRSFALHPLGLRPQHRPDRRGRVFISLDRELNLFVLNVITDVLVTIFELEYETKMAALMAIAQHDSDEEGAVGDGE